jgi:hypothetical protein
MPESVWNAFFVVTLIGVLAGLLCGAEVVSGLALLIFVFPALVVFVVWGVLLLDPQGLAENPTYKGEDQTQRKGRRS